MSIKEDLQIKMKEAMKAKDSLRLMVIRQVNSAIKQVEIDTKEDIDDARVIALIQKEIKAQQESLEFAIKAGRDDLIANAEQQITILEEFTPTAMSDEELASIVQEVITSTEANSPKQMGVVMKEVIPRVAGRADGGRISQIVRQELLK